LNNAGSVAEREGHHPNLHLTNYREVELEIYTHSLGGLTQNDFNLAEAVDKISVKYSPKWLKENQHAQLSAKPKESTDGQV
jgi:4a-hydroxytetrahydrobiopterin dehydratase